MHFLDAWTRLSPLDLARLLTAPACVLLSIVLPGRRAALLASLGLAVATPLIPGAAPLVLRVAWMVLWLGLAAVLARAAEDPPPDMSLRRGGFESGAVGLLLGVALLTLLIAAIARADLDERVGREASYGVLLIALGLVHLMLRRHVQRAAIAFGAMGLGLDRLARTAEAQQLRVEGMRPGAVWVATLLALALVSRIARLRTEAGGGAWVSGAHDLHD